ncbi:MAG: bluetail domain-containing putative surface protein [Cyanobium sp.]
MLVGSPDVAAWVGQSNAGGAGALAAALLRKPAGLPEPGVEPGQEPAAQGWASSAGMVCSELLPESALGLASTDMQVSANPLLDLNLTFLLHSKPDASKVIYLDFNGHTTSGTSWNDSTMGSSFYSPAYDVDANPSLFSDVELIRIQQIWQRVAADFAPFDVDVTLQEPPADWLARTGGSDANWGVRCVITSYGPSSSSAGGIAYIGSFNSSTDTPVFIYNKTLAGVCEAISHEVGHSLWLSHDGSASDTYYAGHGGTGETSWAPVMGNSYGRNVTTWDDGTYTGSNNASSTANYGKGADDLAVIAGNNGFSYQLDLVGDHPFAATALSIAAGTVSQFGTIETRFDADCFSFGLLATGDVNLTFDPYWYRAYVDGDGVWGGAASAYLSRASDSDLGSSYSDHASNLDLAVDLYDSNGVLLYRADSPGLATAISLQGLMAGTYFLKLDGVGFGDPTASTPTGYTDYASVGNYMISGTITSAADATANPVITLAVTPGSVSEDGSSNLVYTFSRSLVTATPLSVNVTVSGTATNGSDYSGLLAGSNQTVTFAANAATASVVIDPTADTSVEADETVSLMLGLGTGYSIGTTSVVTGTISNDDLIAPPLVFTSQADLLTGTAGADRFVLNRHSDALWSSTPDRITNLQAGVDSIDSPSSRTTPIKPKQLGMVQSLDIASIESLLSSKNLAKNGASTFTFNSGTELRTFLALNDATAGFRASSDSVIEITGYTGNLANLAIF